MDRQDDKLLMAYVGANIASLYYTLVIDYINGIIDLYALLIKYHTSVH